MAIQFFQLLHFLNKGYVYKSCQRNWIVVLEKLPDTVTNELRKDVIDARYAKFRADKLKVIMIFNKYDSGEIRPYITNSLYTKVETMYRVGEIVYPDLFEIDKDKICAHGIHYYLTMEPAFYLEKKEGRCVSWYENGQTLCDCTYVQGRLHGDFQSWYENGQIYEVKEYFHGEEVEDEDDYWSDIGYYSDDD